MSERKAREKKVKASKEMEEKKVKSPLRRFHSHHSIFDSLPQDPALRALNASSQAIIDDMQIAADKGDYTTISNIILKQGVPPDSCLGLDNYTPLHVACNKGRVKVAHTLLDAGSNPNAITNKRETPLHFACYNGNIELVELLLDYKAEINAKNQYGETPLFYACRKKHYPIVRLLLQCGADKTIKNDFDDTVYDDNPNDDRLYKELKTEKLRKSLIPLTNELLSNIFKYLDPKSLSRSACVCSKWNRVCENTDLWHALGVSRWEYQLQIVLSGYSASNSSFQFKPKMSFR